MLTTQVSTGTRRFGLLLVVGATALAGCSGGGSEPGGSVRTDPEATTAESSPSGTVGLGSSPEATEAEPGESDVALLSIDDVFDAIFALDPQPPDVALSGSDLLLGGSPDQVTAAAIVDFMVERGVDLTGIEVSVLPVTGTDASLLVFEVIGDVEEFDGGDGGEGGAEDATLLDMPWFQDANIVEVVLILRLEDEDGPVTVTFSFSVEDLRDGLSFDLTGDELFPMQIDRGP